MNYESPSLELMGQMEELTGSAGITVIGDAYNQCTNLEWITILKPVCHDDWYDE